MNEELFQSISIMTMTVAATDASREGQPTNHQPADDDDDGVLGFFGRNCEFNN